MYTQSDNSKRIAKNSLFMTIRMIVVLLITLYTSRIILNVLGVEDYGIYNIVAGFVTMFGFLNSSLSNGIQRFFNYELGKNGIEGANKVYNMALLIQVILAIVIIIPTEVFGMWYLHNKMVIPEERMFAAEWVFQLSLITFLLHILQVPYTASVLAHERMDFYAIISVFDVFVKLGCIFMIPLFDTDYLILYGTIITLIAFISLLAYIIYAKIKFKEIHIRPIFYKSLFKNMLSFSGWNMFGTLGHMFKDLGVNLVLNFFFGPIVNAARGVANQVNSGLQSFVSNITIPVRPQLIQSYSQGNITRSLNLTYTISKLSCFVLLLMALPIILEIDYILLIWLGDKNIPTYTASFIVIIVVNSFLNNLNSAISGLVHASGMMKKYQLAGGSISLISVIVVYVSMLFMKVPELALFVILIMDIIRQIIALIIVKFIVPEFSFNIYIKNVIFPLLKIAFIGMTIPICIHYLLPYGMMRFLIVSILGLFSIGISIYILGLDANEKVLVTNIYSQLKQKLKL